MLAQYRRYAVVVLLILSAIATPDANPTTLLLLFVPLYFLYEASLAIARVIEGRQNKRNLVEQLSN